MTGLPRHGFDDLLSAELHRAAVDLPIAADADVTPILTRGAARQRRQRRLAMLSTFAVLTVITAGTVTAISLAGRGRAPVGDETDPTATSVSELFEPLPAETFFETIPPPTTLFPRAGFGSADPITPVEPALEWNRVDVPGDRALGGLQAPIVGLGPFYTVSTVPVTEQPNPNLPSPPAMYRSDDGLRWDRITDPGNTMLATAAHGTGLYSLGTAPTADAAGYGANLARSTDGGATWSTVDVDFGVAALNRDPAVRHTHLHASLAASDAGLVAIVWLEVSLDPEVLLPGVDTSRGYWPTPDGIYVVSGECTHSSAEAYATVPSRPCGEPLGTEANYPWETLSVTPAVVEFFRHPQPVWFSADGGDWAPIDTSAIEDWEQLALHNVVEYGSGFAALAAVESASSMEFRLLTSPDGVTWESRTIDQKVADTTWSSTSVAAFGTSLVLFQPDSASPSVAVSTDDGATWTTTELAGLLTEADGPGAVFSAGPRAAVGTSGITVWAGLMFEPRRRPGGVTLSKDGVTVHIIANGLDVTDDQTGEVLASERDGEAPSGEWRIVWDEGGGMTVLSLTDGSTVRFSQAELDEALGAGTVQQPNTALVFHSVDGIHWSRQWLHELAGVSAYDMNYPLWMLDGPGGVVISASLSTDSAPDLTGPRPMLALRGAAIGG